MALSPFDECWRQGSEQQVKAYLALGANPNIFATAGMFWTDSGVKSWPVVGPYYAVYCVLARVASVSNPVDQTVILELILAAGWQTTIRIWQ